jgi:hypothetical protein
MTSLLGWVVVGRDRWYYRSFGWRGTQSEFTSSGEHIAVAADAVDGMLSEELGTVLTLPRLLRS